jgi:hypothetical protein
MSDIDIPDEPSVMASRLEDYIWMFYGPPGVGKTTFVKELFGADRTLFISTDRGTRDQSIRRVECNHWKDVRTVYKKLEKKIRGVEVLVFDHVDDIAEMISRYVCEYYSERNNQGAIYETIGEVPHGKGWSMNRSELHSMMNRTLRMGVTPVFIAHESVKEVTISGMQVTKIGPSLNKQASTVVSPLANVIGYINLKRIKREKGDKPRDTRILVTQPTTEITAKDRTGRLKPEKGWEILDPEAFRSSFDQKRSAKGRRAKD